MPSEWSWWLSPGVSCDTITRSGLYEAIASTLGLFPSMLVIGVPGG